MLIGEKIRKIRTLKGFSQDYVSEQLSISQVAYSDIENNKTKLSVDRLSTICTVFDIDIKDLLTFDDKHIFNNTFKDTSKGFFSVEKVINESFENERKAYLNQIQFLKDEILFLRKKLDF